MRMIPSAISEETTSDSERRVFNLLKATDGGAGSRALHSLNLAEHAYKRVGEIDFVVLIAGCVLVLEVKGGGVSFQNGIWRFRDRYGVDHRKSEGPFDQARSGMFALEERVRQELGDELADSLVFGFAVVMTDTSFRIRSVEWSDEMIADIDDLRGAADLTKFIERLARYWRYKARKAVPGARIATTDQVAGVLRPNFDRVPSLQHRADALDAKSERLTNEQYARIDLIEENSRILLSGGAGTGKTFLATELAKRHARNGSRVLFVTSGEMLAAFTRSRISHPSVVVMTVSEIADFPDKYDVLVVDEGQDVLNFPNLDRLDGTLKGGLANGTWRIFFDANKQTGLLGSFEIESVEMLRSYGAVSASLRMNCRNTVQITTYTRLLTSADLGTPIVGDGPQVAVEYFASEKQAAQQVDVELQRLADRSVERGDVTILSQYPIRESCVRLTDAYSRGLIHEMDTVLAASWPTRGITFSTIAEFKGLENRFIVLVDVRALDTSERDVNLLYVAMSRARAGLWVSIDRSLTKNHNDLCKNNMERVVNDLKTSQSSETLS